MHHVGTRGVTRLQQLIETGEGPTVGNLNFSLNSLHGTGIRTARVSAQFPTRARYPRVNMVELDLELILETTDTIVQELLATGEFG